MEDIKGNKGIVYTWVVKRYKAKSGVNPLESTDPTTSLFPTSGVYAKKFVLTFHRDEDSRRCYSYYLSWSRLDIKQKLCISLQLLNYDSNFSVRKERYFSCTCDDTQLDHKIGYKNFCTVDDSSPSPESPAEIALGCEIIFCDELDYRIMQNHFRELMENDALSDFTIEVNNEEFKVHKAILAARSPVFEAMLTIKMVENQTNRLKIEDIDSEILKIMIEFIYTNNVDAELDEDKVQQLLHAAEKYQLEDLKDLCINCLVKTLNMENIADHLMVAVRYKNDNLMAAIKNMMKHNRDGVEILCDLMMEHF